MSRTQARYDSDAQYQDGFLFLSSLADTAYTSGTVTATRNGNGDYSANIGNSQTVVAVMPVAGLLYRTGLQDDLQEQFGAGTVGLSGASANAQAAPGFATAITAGITAGTGVSIPVLQSGLTAGSIQSGFKVGQVVTLDTVASGVQEFPQITSIPDATHIVVNRVKNTHAAPAPVTGNLFTTPAGVTGRPPFTGLSQLTPVTGPRPKGILIKAIYPWYLVTGLALTLNTIGLIQTVAANGVANAVTNLIADANNGLPTAIQATPYLFGIPVPLAQQQFITTKFSSLNIEWDVTTGASGTARLYGVFLDVTFNYV